MSSEKVEGTFLTFARTWNEELVAEYLELENYLVKIGHPVQIGKAGGRKEIDILGIKSQDGASKILHVEIGQPARSEEEIKVIIAEKFDEVVSNEIKKIAEAFGCSKFTYERWYIPTWPVELTKSWMKLKEDLKSKNIMILSFIEFLKKVEGSIHKWKEDNKTPKGTRPTLPANLWMLKMVESIQEAGLFQFPR